MVGEFLVSVTNKRNPLFISAVDLPVVPASHEDPKNPGVLKKILIGRGVLPIGEIPMVNIAFLGIGKSFALHYHEDMDEVFIVLTGKAIMKVGGREFMMGEHDAVVVPAGSTHEMHNKTDQSVTYLVFGISQGKGGKTVCV